MTNHKHTALCTPFRCFHDNVNYYPIIRKNKPLDQSPKLTQSLSVATIWLVTAQSQRPIDRTRTYTMLAADDDFQQNVS